MRSPKRQLTHRLAEQAADVEQIDQFVAAVLELLRLDAIDFLMQTERFLGGQIPPELIFLPHHQGEAAAIGVFAPPGNVAEHSGCAAAGGDDAGQ